MKVNKVSGREYINERGVALLLIMWVLFLLSVISAEFAFSMRTDFTVTLNFKEEMEAYYLARAGINQAIAKILHQKMLTDQRNRLKNLSLDEEYMDDSYQTPDWAKNMGNGTFAYELTDEQGKININSLRKNNSLDRKIIRCLLENAAGVEDESTQNTIIDSIIDWMDTDDLYKTSGAEEDYYQGLSPPYHCKNGPFDTVEELLLVQGVTQEILFGNKTTDPEEEKQYPGIGRYLTVWTSGKFDIKTAKLLPISCKLGEDAAENEGNRRQDLLDEEDDIGGPRKEEIPPSPFWTIKATGYSRNQSSKRTIMATITLTGKKNIPTVKFLYWDDNYMDRFVQYQEPEEELAY